MALEQTDKVKAEKLLEDARGSLEQNDLTSAQTKAAEARGVFRKLGEAAREAEAVQCIVQVLTQMGDLEEATREAYDALNIVKRANDGEAIAAASSLAVSTHYNSLNKDDMNRDSDAFKEGVKELLGSAEECVKAYKKLKDIGGQASALVGYARVQMLADLPDNAKLSADWAYMLYNQTQDGNGFYDACITLVYVHLQRADFASAMRYTNEAKELCMAFQDAQRMYEVGELTETISRCTHARNQSVQQSQNHWMTAKMMKMNFR